MGKTVCFVCKENEVDSEDNDICSSCEETEDEQTHEGVVCVETGGFIIADPIFIFEFLRDHGLTRPDKKWEDWVKVLFDPKNDNPPYLNYVHTAADGTFRYHIEEDRS